MDRGPLVVIVLIILGVLGFGAYELMRPHPEPAAPTAAATPGEPPPGAPVLPDEMTEEGIMLEVGTARSKSAQQAAEALYKGAWIGPLGWSGAIEDITEEKTGWAVRIKKFTPRLIGQEYWVIAVLDEQPYGLAKGDTVRVRGRIDAVEVLPGGMTPVYRIVVREAGVTKG